MARSSSLMTSYGGASSLSGAPAFLVYRMPRNGAISAISARTLASAASTLSRICLRRSLSFCDSAGSDSARIAAARSAAFCAPPMATVATGRPGGICTVESSESSPPSVPADSGTPITGSVVCATTRAGQVRGQPGAGDEHLDALALGVARVAARLFRRAVRRQDAQLGLDAELGERLLGLLHRLEVAVRSHQDADLRAHGCLPGECRARCRGDNVHLRN